MLHFLPQASLSLASPPRPLRSTRERQLKGPLRGGVGQHGCKHLAALTSILTPIGTRQLPASGRRWRGRRCCGGPVHGRASSFPVSTAPASIFQEDEWVTEVINLPQLLLRSPVPRSCAPPRLGWAAIPRARCPVYPELCRGRESSPPWLVRGLIESRRPLARLPVWCVVMVGAVCEHHLRPH